MKAIETVYKGYRFRSRLEARWAVFFDALQMPWEYEPEGFVLDDGTHYLPDFWLPKFNGERGMWVEVKPEALSTSERMKARLLARGTGDTVLLAVGVPSARVYEVVYPNAGDDGKYTEYACFVAKYLAAGKFNCCNEYRLYVEPGYEERDGSIDEKYVDDPILMAIRTARGARFEHGERRWAA